MATKDKKKRAALPTGLRPRTVRLYIAPARTSRRAVSAPGLDPVDPRDFYPPEYYGVPEIPPATVIPPVGSLPNDSAPLQVGDRIDKVGYLDFVRLNELGYFPPAAPGGDGRKAFANRFLEQQSYCLVGVSDSVNASTNVETFRILYANLSGEKLAASMAVVAALKDAFAHRLKVCVHGEWCELAIAGAMFGASDPYWLLRSVDLVRV